MGHWPLTLVRYSVIRACIDSSKKFGGAEGLANHFPSPDSIWRTIIDSPANNSWNCNISCQSPGTLQGAEPGGPPTSNTGTGRLGLLWHEAFTGFVMTFASACTSSDSRWIEPRTRTRPTPAAIYLFCLVSTARGLRSQVK